MSKWHGPRTEVDGAISADAKLKISEAAIVMMQGVSSEEADHTTLTQKYMSSKEHMVASDLILQSSTAAHGLKHFMSEKTRWR